MPQGQYSLNDAKPIGQYSLADAAPVQVGQGDHSKDIPAPSMDNTYLPKFRAWLQENHPKILSFFDSLATSGPRGIDQMTHGLTDPNKSTATRVADTIEGGATAMTPALLAIPGSGQVGSAVAGLAGTAAAQPVASSIAQHMGAEPDTARAIGDVAAVGAGALGAHLGPEAIEGLKTAGQVVTDPTVIKKGIAVIPKGKEALDWYNTIKDTWDKVKAGQAPKSDLDKFPARDVVEVMKQSATPGRPDVSRESTPEPSQGPQSRGKGMPQATKDAGKMIDKLVEWKFSPDEVKSMGDQSWNKLAFDAGVPAGATKAMKQRVWMGLANKLAGPPATGEELMQRLRASLPQDTQ